MTFQSTERGISMVASIIIVAVLVIAGGGLYVASKSMRDPQPLKIHKDDVVSDGEINTSVRELMMSGSPVTCTFTRTDDGMNTSGTVYIAGERMRGDFTVESEGLGTFVTHTIHSDTTAYVWTDGQAQGHMFTLNADQDVEAPHDEQSFDIDEKVDYSCFAWSVDEGQFQVPTDIEFTDWSEQVQATVEAQAEVSGIQCSQCEQLPAGVAREQCLAALGCN